MTDSVSCKSSLPECVSGTMESYANVDAIYCAQSSIRNDNIERYNHSPQLYRKNTSFKGDEVSERIGRCRSPDIIATKICTELDLIASHAPSIIITPEEPVTQIVSSNSHVVDDWNKRTQPDGKEIQSAKNDVKITSTPSEDNLDGMLDRISHDLDYLLNRSEDQDVCTGSLKRMPKTTVSTTLNEEIIEETEEIKVPESITDILRTNC